MGTRNLTIVIQNEEPKIAQYGQWDGYPSGQGYTALKFLRSKARRNKLQKKLTKIRFVADEKQKEIKDFFKSIGAKDGWMNMEQSAKYQEKYPLFTRDNGAEILNLVTENKDKIIWLYDLYEFADSNSGCEWAYIIDYDKETFEVYSDDTGLDMQDGDRFKFMRCIRTYSFDNLPTKRIFLSHNKE